jgi:hypothetical protein
MMQWIKTLFGRGTLSKEEAAALQRIPPMPPEPTRYPAVPLEDREEGSDPTCLGRWVRMALDDKPEPMIGFVYLDRTAGLSLRGDFESAAELATRPMMTVRLPYPSEMERLSADEIERRALPAQPSWLSLYGPQPRANARWRADPELRPHLNETFPDDVSVVVHDGETRRTGKAPELCWVHIVEAIQGPLRDELSSEPSVVYVGTLLNAPHELSTVRKGDTVHFLAGHGLKAPLLVTERYLLERGDWSITPCSKCGAAECMDPPSVMAETRFSNQLAGIEMKLFSSICAQCGGIQLLAKR